MCKNVQSPCPGCKNTKTTDDALMFFTEDERQTLGKSGKAAPQADAPR
ncbi:hypothetical protein LA6_005881 (plasmid) [Marinibacterium anthonyi]|nr:hypothetical protein LA6_005881 [Marinibacterium anthonyi]